MNETRLRLRQRSFLIRFLPCTIGSVRSGRQVKVNRNRNRNRNCNRNCEIACLLGIGKISKNALNRKPKRAFYLSA
jgi:hypothetical protein